MWNMADRSCSGRFFIQKQVNNWHFGKRRKEMRAEMHTWKVLIDLPTLFISVSPAPTWWAANYGDAVDAMWIAWRE